MPNEPLVNPATLEPHLAADKRTAVLFFQPWCPFCQSFLPLFQKFAAEKASDYACLLISLEDYAHPFWTTYGLSVVPSVIVFEKGEIVKRLDGALFRGLSEKELRKL